MLAMLSAQNGRRHGDELQRRSNHSIEIENGALLTRFIGTSNPDALPSKYRRQHGLSIHHTING